MVIRSYSNASRYQGFSIYLAAVLFCCFASSNAYAQLVLYDGAIGDADPVSQGWDLTINPDPAIATVTPDPNNDLVSMSVQLDLVGDPGDPRDLQYSLPTNIPIVQDYVGDDSYQWRLKFNLNEFIFMGFPTGITNHTLTDFRFITGRSSGSAGYDDRFFIEQQRFRLAATAGKRQFQADFAHRDEIHTTFPIISPPEFDISPNFNSMLDTNELTFNRVGNRAEIFINGDFVYSGYSNRGGGSSSQTILSDGANNKITAMSWHSFVLDDDPQPMIISNPPAYRTLYDGSYFGGDPIKQGWFVEPVSPSLTLTPDALDESVHIENVGSAFRFKIDNGLIKAAREVMDDYYKWTIEFSVDPSNHEVVLFKAVGGEGRETVQVEDDKIIVSPTVNLAVEGSVALQAAAGFDMIITPGETPNFTSMSDINELSIYRKGEEVFMTINGDIVFRGVGGTQPLHNDGQFYIQQDTGAIVTDINLYNVEISTALDGDYDADGDVDDDDYAVWVAHFGEEIPIFPTFEQYRADGNYDGLIDAGDYTVWRDNLGATVPFLGLTVPLIGADATAVPEPTACFQACFAIAASMGWRTRRRFMVAGRA